MLSKRLLTCIKFIKIGATVCDVGCDHGYLSCYLIEQGIAKNVIATDVNDKPLLGARENIARFGYTNKIKTMISDGLKSVDLNFVDNIVIAGMGGELILKIIKACDKNRLNDKILILQPMTNIPVLRQGLYENGFVIEDEIAVKEKGHWYTVMKVVLNKEELQEDNIFYQIGVHMKKSYDKNSHNYMKHLQNKYKKILGNIKNSKNLSEEKFSEYEIIINRLDEILGSEE